MTTGRWPGWHERRKTRSLRAAGGGDQGASAHAPARAIRQIGPGLILAASIVGTGELINTTSLGAKAGFSLLWLILLSCVIKVFVQVELGRYAITHGKTTLAAFDTLPGPRLGVSWLCWLWLLMMLTTQAQIAAMEGTVGQAAHMAFPRASDAIAAGAGALVRVVGCRIFEPRRAFLGGRHHPGGGLVVALRRIPAAGANHDHPGGRRHAFHRGERADLAVDHVPHHACPISKAGSSWRFRRPRWPWPSRRSASRASARRSFSPIPTGASKRATHATRVSELKTPAWAHRAQGWTRVMQLDAWISMLVFTIATVAFYFLGAAVLHPQGLDPKGPDMIPTLSRMYLQPLEGTPLAALRPFTYVGFLLGAWAVLFKTLYVATAANSRMTADFLSRLGVWHTDGPAKRDRVVKLFCVIYPTLSLGLYYAFREPQALIKAGGIAQALMLPFIAGATIYLRRRDTDPRVAPSRQSDILTWIAFVAITAVAAYSTFDQVRGLIVGPARP